MKLRTLVILGLLALSIPALAATLPATSDIGAIDILSLVPGGNESGVDVGDIQFGSAFAVVIQHPGSYFLSEDFTAGSGIAIEIRSSDVTLDLRGHTLNGRGGKRGVGVAVSSASNVSVLNGKIQNFGIGVQVTGSTNVRVSGLQVDGEDLGGAPPEVEIGIMLVDSRGVWVRDNLISETFLGIFVRGASGANRIENNLIAGLQNGELAICYNPAPGNTTGGPSGDLIYGNQVSRFRRAFSFSTDSVGNVLRENTFAYFDLGIAEATAGSNVIEGNTEITIAR